MIIRTNEYVQREDKPSADMPGLFRPSCVQRQPWPMSNATSSTGQNSRSAVYIFAPTYFLERNVADHIMIKHHGQAGTFTPEDVALCASASVHPLSESQLGHKNAASSCVERTAFPVMRGTDRFACRVRPACSVHGSAFERAREQASQATQTQRRSWGAGL
mmetsp:Transcript_23399/g.53192  ORF Transcript_23399/g.53192 Transcript_23399/m.53192 type:complete len:161 (-) Transcript_23399:1605-2087(-)